MTSISVFLIGVGCTGLASFAAIAYLTPSLRAILRDLCGTEERANFWTAFSNLALVLTPFIFALHEIPDASVQTPPVLQLAAQTEGALIGLVSTVLVVGFVISRFIPRAVPAPRGTASGTAASANAAPTLSGAAE